MKKTIAPLMALLSLTLFTMSCKKESSSTPPTPPPTANFTFVTDGLKSTFTNSSTNAKSYSWNFGDATAASTETNPVHTYAAAGTYSVTLTVTGNDNSTKTATKDVTVTAPVTAGPNLVQGGDMSDQSKWTRFPIYDGVDVTFAGGVAKWSGGNTTGTGGGHIGIYQSFNVEAGKTYQLDMDISAANINNVWFEVYVSPTVPAAGTDYNFGGIKLAINTWDCASTNKTFNGKFSNVSCAAKVGSTTAWKTITFPTSGTVYLMIRGGGDDYTLTGGTGVTIDNVDFHAIN